MPLNCLNLSAILSEPQAVQERGAVWTAGVADHNAGRSVRARFQPGLYAPGRQGRGIGTDFRSRVGGVWFNDRLNSVAQTNNDLTDQLQAAEQREAELMAAIKTQQDMTYKAPLMFANPGSSVNLLRGDGAWTSARGVMMLLQTGTDALLLVVGLTPLPADKVYPVWLMKEQAKYNAGWFTVGSTGYGQTVIIPVAPFWEFEAAGITIEPAGGSVDPTGVNILKGDV